ncbi:flagellar basal body rod protein [Ideonella dechloratans]|uniref:Flagellar basal body rod protein n=1 Tax=Ideonella dechloratans TaxID=36863 RepID=A0A643F415_IDEDE|nr:flagellar basal body protein [Ideonella dechloratans]KAB0572841.1 flagellar basal body rod protein [Ideonella dechloratans]UFU10202.1 flagellar basal body protein [Ideonella dechloratans]
MSTLPTIASSGLAAAQARLDASANNIANVATPRYRREDVVQSTRASGGVDAQPRQLDAQGEAGASTGQLTQDVVNQKVALYNFQANVMTLKTEGSMVGSLLDCSA